MTYLFKPARALALDLAATIVFLALYAVTHDVRLSVALGAVLALAQIGWRLARGHSVDALQWVSLGLVLALGGATLITANPVFVMLKPSLIYLVVGAGMLQRGWMRRFMPQRALELMPDVIVTFGYAWAGLMFFSAALNLALALGLSVVAWGTAMTAWGIASKAALFFAQYGAMRLVGLRRRRARLA